MSISIYTDGACKMSTRDGGWAMVVVKDDQVIHQSHGTAEKTTNNVMELTALWNGLIFAKALGQGVTILTDSKYCCDGYNDWCFNWVRKGWKTATKKPVENQELWSAIHAIRDPKIKIEWVRGHNGDKWNEYCDSLTRGYEK